MASKSSTPFSNPWEVRAWWHKVKDRPRLGILLTGAGISIVFLAYLTLIQFSSPDLAGNDGYYHIRFAEIMRSEGLRPDFPWLPLTILNEREFYDHHFLYHVLLTPFTLGELIQGAKWASVLFASLAFLSIWWLFHSQRVSYASLWSLGLLAVSGAFIYRMSMARAQSLSLAVLVLSLYFLFSRKHKWLLPLAFIYVWLYDAFPLILVTAGIYVISVWMIDRKLNLNPLLLVGAGIVLGMIINPYFPDNVVFIFRHILPKLTEATSIRVGNEWFPYDTAQLLSNSPLALVAFAGGILGLGLRDRRMNARTATALLMALIFGLMMFQARRFVEYFPPFALIFAAFAWDGNLSPFELSEASERKNGVPTGKAMAGRFLRSWLPVAVLGAFIIPGIALTVQNARETMQDSKPTGYYAESAAWLVNNTGEGMRIFQTDWDDFTRLFFYNTHNTYLVGLDPTYMQLYNPGRYEQWVDITQGRVENPSESIAFDFGAEYVFSDLDHEAFIEQAENDPGMIRVYRDDEAVIFRIDP